MLTGSAFAQNLFPHINVVGTQPTGACPIANNLEQYGGDIYTCDPVTAQWRLLASSTAGSGNVNPAPQYALSIYPNAGTNPLVGGSTALTTDATGAFYAKGNQAIGSTCTNAATIPYSPAGCHIFSNESMGPNGILLSAVNGNALTHTQYETTPDTSSGFGDLWIGLDNSYIAGYGGVYTEDPNVGGQKTNYIADQKNCTWDTMASYDCEFMYSFAFGGGDNVGHYLQMFNYADFAGLGEETAAGVDVNMQQGYSNSNPGTGGAWEGTIGAINSGTGVVSYTPNAGAGGCAAADCDGGAGRFVRDLTRKYNTGTYTINPSTDCSTTVGDQFRCTIHGVGTTWTSISGFVGTHTVYRSGSHYSPMVSNNLCMSINPGTNGNGSNDGYDFTIPIVTGVDDTHLTVYIYPNGGWPAPLSNSGTYAIYPCAWPLQIDKVNHTFTAGGPDTSGMHTGDTMDQTFGYTTDNSSTGVEINMARHTGLSNFGVGLSINNFSDATAPPFGNATQILGSWFTDLAHEASTDYIIDSFADTLGSTFRFNSQSATQQNFIQYGDSAHFFRNGMFINQNAASSTAGLGFFDNALVVTPQDQIIMQNGAMQSDGAGNFNANVSIGTTIGGTGGVQNQVQDSQFQTIGTYWPISCVGTGGSISANTTDFVDPFNANTALKVVVGTTQPCLPSNGAYLNLVQTMSVASVLGHTYVLRVQMCGAAGGEQVQFNLSGAFVGGVPAVTLKKCTASGSGWTNFPFQFVANGASGTKQFSFAFFTPGSTVYIDNVQVADVSVGGSLYAWSNPTPVSPTLGQTLFGEVLPLPISSGGTTGHIAEFTSATAIANSPFDDGITTTGVVTSSKPIAVTGAPMFKTGTSSNSDVTGILTAVSGTATYTFVNTYASAPVCVVQDDTTIGSLLTKTVSTTTLTATTTGSTDHVSYVCVGRN